jgi:hypothetical protein
LKQTNSLTHRGGNGRPRVLSEIEKKAIGQYIRRNNEITSDEILEKLSTIYHSTVSASTILRYLHRCGYRNVLPKTTHMLTFDDKKRRIQWAKQHKNDNFTHTIFTDEASFQIFRNTVRRWSKCPKNQVKPKLLSLKIYCVFTLCSSKCYISCTFYYERPKHYRKMNTKDRINLDI